MLFLGVVSDSLPHSHSPTEQKGRYNTQDLTFIMEFSSTYKSRKNPNNSDMPIIIERYIIKSGLQVPCEGNISKNPVMTL